MRNTLRIVGLFGLIISCIVTLIGCGSGGGTHGATDPTQNIIVFGDEPNLHMLFPDRREGGANLLREVAANLDVGLGHSLGFVENTSGYYWTLTATPTVQRTADGSHKQWLVRIPRKQNNTRGSSPPPYNVVLTLENGDRLLVTDSAADPKNALAIGWAGEDAVYDADATEEALTAVISSILPNVPARAYVAETTSIVALRGWQN